MIGFESSYAAVLGDVLGILTEKTTEVLRYDPSKPDCLKILKVAKSSLGETE